MPPTNPGRRRALTDAAIELLAGSGVHGLTHRAVEQAAGLPQGTASNYFRTREALLLAVAERVSELHLADMAEATRQAEATADGIGQTVELLAESLFGAATVLRTRYLAIFELQLEAVRRPAMAPALAGLQDTALRLTAGHHADLALPIPRDRVATLVMLYAGALFTLVTAPPESITREGVHEIAHAIVQGALSGTSADNTTSP
ncbi:TetR/AcrR family transcriptional regulator [Nonomuraea endophytica]|uniref:TetR/AcrR family transcriptional regulator n=1 Tax=Nonomuraea endophytica TaxID=714136 RepID=UPI0037C7D7A4